MKEILFNSNYAHELANNLYTCTVPELAVAEPEFIRSFGVHSTGFDDADKQLSNRRSRVMLTIPVMVRYFVEGVDITILDDEDLIKIHTLINGYLNEWRAFLDDSINIRVSPYEDYIRDLDEFNGVIYTLLEDTELFEEKDELPPMFIRGIDITGDGDRRRNEFERKDYRDQYGDMFETLRERRSYEK